VLPEVPKVSSFSPLLGPLEATVVKEALVFSYDSAASLPAAEN
jgi:hypothetical protein